MVDECDNGDIACDSYNNIERDIQLLVNMNVKVFDCSSFQGKKMRSISGSFFDKIEYSELSIFSFLESIDARRSNWERKSKRQKLLPPGDVSF